ncbi:hypothetical protein WICMUC_000911 [Wickerhamomyces mucosus]|uniref:Glyceraldehyde-3-phosphate dehydrogenase n=1 Tax=Wickerhamomyces mucosus TaxID=1378264 RepID=A0A9P8THA7_9ASCO|nr:hypothetical protein WICMUC_000911 [Wickerhamomyces mucosus]
MPSVKTSYTKKFSKNDSIKTINVGINGFGRIGRLVLRNILSRQQAVEKFKIDVVAINNPSTDSEYAAYLFKYDSTHGKFQGKVSYEKNFLIINESKIKLVRENDPLNIQWGTLDVDYVIESTGVFKEKDTASKHLHSGAKKVIVTAPSSTIPMFVFGVNELEITKDLDIVSNASCTTNCLAPLLKVIDENFHIKEALMTTIHSATASQKLVDGTSQKDWRGGRSAPGNIIPSTTGAAKAVSSVIPQLKGKITGLSIRVPTVNISLVDLTFKTEKTTSYEAISELIKKISNSELGKVIGYTDESVVSSDFLSDPRSCIYDSKGGLELNGQFFKVLAWYDNEFGYSARVVDLLYHFININQ